MDSRTQEKVRAARVMFLVEVGLSLAVVAAAFTIIFARWP
jgi:hypothetical protein